MAKLGREYLADKVLEHAKRYYEAGWSVVVETMSKQDIVNILGRTRTVTGAVTTVAEYAVRPWVEKLVETRPGNDDDEQLQILARFNEERRANTQDATLWWSEDDRKALLDRMASPEGAIIQVPGQRTEVEIPPLVPVEPEKKMATPARRTNGNGKGRTTAATTTPRNRSAARSTANRK